MQGKKGKYSLIGDNSHRRKQGEGEQQHQQHQQHHQDQHQQHHQE